MNYVSRAVSVAIAVYFFKKKHWKLFSTALLIFANFIHTRLEVCSSFSGHSIFILLIFSVKIFSRKFSWNWFHRKNSTTYLWGRSADRVSWLWQGIQFGAGIKCPSKSNPCGRICLDCAINWSYFSMCDSIDHFLIGATNRLNCK